MEIDNFKVSERCRYELKRVGFTRVEEIVDFLEQHSEGGAMIRAPWLKCFAEIVSQIKVQGFWTDVLESAWPDKH